MKPLWHHYWTRQKAIARSIGWSLAGALFYLVLTDMLGPGVAPKGTIAEAQNRNLTSLLTITAPLLFLFARFSSRHARGPAVAEGQADWSAEPHPALPLGPRSRALIEASAWLPVWWILLIGLTIPALVFVVRWRLAGFESVLADWPAEYRPHPLGELWRTFGTPACVAFPFVVAYLLGQGKTGWATAARIAPWMVVVLIAKYVGWLETVRTALAVGGVLLVGVLAVGTWPNRLVVGSFPQPFRVRQPRARTARAPQETLRLDAVRGWAATFLLWAPILPVALYLLSLLSYRDLLSLGRTWRDILVPDFGLLQLPALSGMAGAVLVPLGIHAAVGARTNSRRPRATALGSAWSALPLLPRSIVRTYYLSTLASAILFAGIFYAGGWLGQHATLLSFLPRAGVLALLAASAVPAYRIGTRHVHVLAVVLPIIVFAWRPCYAILDLVTRFYLEEYSAPVLLPPPSWLFYALAALAGLFLTLVLFWPHMKPGRE